MEVSFLLFACSALALLVQGQDQSGFISIDCGITEGSNYTDQMRGIYYSSDEGFIDTGESKAISSDIRNNYILEQYLFNVRSFPQGIRNCYALKPEGGRGNKYLIRALFLYGNYDGKNQPPQFDVHIGTDFWETVLVGDLSSTWRLEIIHVSSTDYIYVCLVNTGNGTPFISTLELRPLNNRTYATTDGSSLSYFWRYDLGSTAKIYDLIRYKDDAYDRIWRPRNYDYPTINTSFIVDSGSNVYQLPSKVMSTAVTPTAGSDSLQFIWEADSITDQFYFYLHFAEVQVLQENQSREFNIYSNGYPLNTEPVVPDYLSTKTLAAPFSVGYPNFEISINKTSKSTHPPILNALELYTVKQLVQLQTDDKDVDAIANIKSMYGVRRNWQGDPCVSAADVWVGLSCSYDGVHPPRIISLNLSSSGLTGEITPYIANLTMIQTLDLSNNSLIGQVPDFLSRMTSLKVLFLKGNNFSTDSIPAQLLARSKDKSLLLSIDGIEDENTEKKNKVAPVVAITAAVLSLFLLTAIVAVMWIIKRRKQEVVKNEDNVETKQRVMTYSEVLTITNNFQEVIGEGGFGKVYHGYAEDSQVAVKMLSPSSIQGYKEFHAEANLLMKVRHKNLTSLIGYCNEGTNLGIVYEYMAKGDLKRLLLDSNSNVLSWETRLRIATDAAQGLEYLHHGCKPPIIHRDVKTTNILLNEKFEAKLADFGLSRVLLGDDGTYVSTSVVAGTPGYLDPECYESNKLTEKSDVYSFGVVLLEIITSRPPIQHDHSKTNIIQWVSFMLANGDIRSIVDPRLLEDFDVNTAWKVVELAMACVSRNSTRRPTMYNVVMELRECLATERARHETLPKHSVEVMPSYLESDMSLPAAR